VKIYKEVPLSSINLQKTNYLHSYPERTSLLIKSIKEFGILQPPLLLDAEEGLIILCGEGRVKASLNLGLETIPCLVLKDRYPDKELHFISLHSNLFRPLNLIEKSIFFTKVYPYLTKEEIDKVLKILNLPIHQNIIKILFIINKLNDDYKKFILNEKLNPQILKYYDYFTEEDFFSLLNLCVNLSLSFSEQRELFELANDLKKLGKLEEFLKEISGVLIFEDFNKRKRAYKEIFISFRFPFYSQKWEKVQEIKNFFSHKGIDVQYVPYLEEREVEIRLKTDSLEDFEECVNFLKDHGRKIFAVFEG